MDPKSRKNRPKSGSEKVFSGTPGRAFSDFWQGDTGGPFIFWRKTLFLRKMVGFRGWCNIVRGPG